MDAVDISIPFAVATAISAGLPPLVDSLARRLGIVDRPNERSVNQRQNIPLMGGLAVAAGCAASLALALAVTGTSVAPTHLLGLVAGVATRAGRRRFPVLLVALAALAAFATRVLVVAILDATASP